MFLRDLDTDSGVMQRLVEPALEVSQAGNPDTGVGFVEGPLQALDMRQQLGGGHLGGGGVTLQPRRRHEQ